MKRDPLLLEALRNKPRTSEITIEIGSESHTTSWGNVSIKTLKGQYLSRDLIFEQKDQGNGFYLTTFLLPIGTKYSVTAKGQSGPRGVNKDRIEMIIEITKSRKEWQLPAGPKMRQLKGYFKVVWANKEARDHFDLAKSISLRSRKERLLTEGTIPPASSVNADQNKEED